MSTISGGVGGPDGLYRVSALLLPGQERKRSIPLVMDMVNLHKEDVGKRETLFFFCWGVLLLQRKRW